MVKVHLTTTDPITAWRIRDVLACHPLLGSAGAHIQVEANHETIVLRGWAVDAQLLGIAQRLAQGSAGRRAVQLQLETGTPAGSAKAAHRKCVDKCR